MSKTILEIRPTSDEISLALVNAAITICGKNNAGKRYIGLLELSRLITFHDRITTLQDGDALLISEKGVHVLTIFEKEIYELEEKGEQISDTYNGSL